MPGSSDYTEALRLVKSLLIVTSLQKREDIKALKALKSIREPLIWNPHEAYMIAEEVWRYAVDIKHYDPKLVFCHPDILLKYPITSIYYRGICGLSIKAAKDYFGSIENLEKGNKRARLSKQKALKMAQTYNTYICSIIKNSSSWVLENGYRTIIATLGITLDGVMRNKVGDVAEQRIRTMVLEWIIDHKLLIEPKLSKEKVLEEIPRLCKLKDEIYMEFSSEPDISFFVKHDEDKELKAVVEIKGGIDPAGALERYGAATKSFQHALSVSPRCKNFFLSAVFTDELERRIRDDRLVEKYFDIVKMLEDSIIRDNFFTELFHFALRYSYESS